MKLTINGIDDLVVTGGMRLDESNEFWVKQELLDKHKNYLINSNNISNNL